MAAISVVLMAGLGLFLARTRWGLAIRAVAQDLDAARSLAVPVTRLYPAHDGPCLGACGRRRRLPRRALLRLPDGRRPAAALQALIVVVLGGLGSLTGTLYAAYLRGADAVVLRGRDRHDMDAPDPLRRDPRHPRLPPVRAQGQPLGGAAVTGTFGAVSARPLGHDRGCDRARGALPLVYHDPYYMTIIVTGEIVLILNISWNFVLGMAGVWNFGQLAIYALGAYGAGWLMLHRLGVPVPIAILLGGVFSAGHLGAARVPDAAAVRDLHVAADVLVRPGRAVRRRSTTRAA